MGQQKLHPVVRCNEGTDREKTHQRARSDASNILKAQKSSNSIKFTCSNIKYFYYSDFVSAIIKKKKMPRKTELSSSQAWRSASTKQWQAMQLGHLLTQYTQFALAHGKFST